MSLPITLAMFTSTKGHFGKDTYRYTVDRMDLSLFTNKVVHVKYEDGDGEKITKMLDYFNNKQFKAICSKGKWKHNDNSHYVEHSKDIATLMQSEEVQSQPFVYWTEDDIVLKMNKAPGELLSLLNAGIFYLRNLPEKMCVRILDKDEYLPMLKVESSNGLIFNHADCFSFRANLMRSRDVWALGSFFKNDFPHRQIHIERYATQILQMISGQPVAFGCYETPLLRHVHIGSQEFDETKEY